MVAASFFLFFFLSIITLSLASVNIDCGTSSSNLDENNIQWVGDKDFITSGVSATVYSTTHDKYLTTLRYFPTGDSNCYTNIPVTKGGKVLVRTMFYYGNYDEDSSSLPSFSVVFEGKHRGTVSISSAFEPYILELIFYPAGEETCVCFVRTSSSNPFVSSIEVSDLEDGMYDELGPGEGLFYHLRIAYGVTETLRSDTQGRFWLPSGINLLFTETPSMAASIDTSGAPNNPPESVLRNSWSFEDLSLVDPTLPSKGVPVYLAMYFSEPLQTGARSFNVFFGGKQVNKLPVVPVFGKAIQLVVRDVVASSSTEMVFKSTTGALLPPLINAAEIYVISKGTNGDGGNGSRSSGSKGGGSGNSGGGGGGDSGNGESGSKGTGGNIDVSSGSGGSTNGKNSKVPTIAGVVSAVAFVVIAYVIIAVVLANRRKVKLQALALPTSTTVGHMGTGASPLFGQAMGNDSSQPTTEGDMGDIDDLIGVNQSYVAQ